MTPFEKFKSDINWTFKFAFAEQEKLQFKRSEQFV
jgi:hypothetical protein